MTVAIVYIFPANAGEQYTQHAIRFIQSYIANPPGIAHESIIVLNGASRCTEIECLFSSLQNVRILEHDNSGYDIGAYQKAAAEVPADLMMFFGSTAYLKRPGWLLRMLQARMKHGDTLYGTHGNRGAGGVQPHVRTTGFAISTSLLNQYPHRATRPEHRYEWEHGTTCLCSWIKKRGLIPWIVAGDGDYQWEQWDLIPNGFHRGNQSNLLCGDRMTLIPYGCDTP